MAGYRNSFIRFAAPVTAGMSTGSLVKRTGMKLLVPVYHLVSDEQPKHTKGLYKARTVREFEADLDFLLENFKPVDYPKLLEIVKSGSQPQEASFILTFDDGLREFHDIVAPILLRRGITAINFLNSDFIGNRDLFFRYKVALLLDAFAKDKSLAKLKQVQDWIWQESLGKNLSIDKILLSIKYDKRAELDVLARIINVNFADYLEAQKPYMDLDQIKALKQQGFYFGGHSTDHPEYRLIDEDEQVRQTLSSVDWVEQELGLDYRCFAFPFTDYGVKSTFFDAIRGKVDLSFGSAGLKRETVDFHIQRIPMEMDGLNASQIVNGEYLYYRFKNMFGRNMSNR